MFTINNSTVNIYMNKEELKTVENNPKSDIPNYSGVENNNNLFWKKLNRMGIPNKKPENSCYNGIKNALKKMLYRIENENIFFEEKKMAEQAFLDSSKSKEEQLFNKIYNIHKNIFENKINIYEPVWDNYLTTKIIRGFVNKDQSAENP